MNFDFSDYPSKLLCDMIAEVGQGLFLKYTNKTEDEKLRKHFYGWVCRVIRKELDRRMAEEYDE